MSPMSSAAGVGRTSIVCQWLSISPGISVRPPPSITVALPGTAMSLPIFAILLPTTRTDVLAVRLVDLPLNTLTFLNSVALGWFASLLASG